MMLLKSLIGCLVVVDLAEQSGATEGARLTKALVEGIRQPECVVAWKIADWDVHLRLAKSANLIGRLAGAVNRVGMWASVPTQVQPHLLSAQVLADHQREAIRWEVKHIEKALAGLGHPVVLLKGAAYATAHLDAAQGRLFGDVDVLVPQVAMAQAESLLMLHGWSKGDVDPYDERYYREWMHEIPPMTHRMRGTVIDLHHNLLPTTAKWAPLAELFLNDSVGLQGSSLKVLSPEDRVVHSATHLFHEGELKNGLRDLFDLDALLREGLAADPTFIERVIDRAIEHKLVWPVQLALRYTRHFLSTPVSDQEMGRVNRLPGACTWGLRCMDFLYTRALLPDHPRCQTASSAFARAVIYLRSHALRMPIDKLLVHLSRKAFMRLYKNTSRTD